MTLPTQKPNGQILKNCSGFPLFFDGRKRRIITADAWSFLRHLVEQSVNKKSRAKANSYIDQALDFYEAASNPRIGSKPLLYYYSFLNLAKVYLIVNKVILPPAVKHGISDPKINIKKRVKFEGQVIRPVGVASDHSEFFPELVKTLGGAITRPNKDIKVLDILAQIPSIHRTFVKVKPKKHKSSFIPIKRIQVLRDNTHVWAQVILQKDDKDVSSSLPKLKKQAVFKELFKQVCNSVYNNNEICFETNPILGRRRGIDPAIVRLSTSFQKIGVWSILTSDGYKFYFSSINSTMKLPPLAAAYAAMFYFGSITRYKPYDYGVIMEGGYSWIVREFMATQPTQFLYTLASHLAGVDVVRPYAV